MNEEVIELKGIDEIPMFSWNTKTKEFFVLGHKFDGVNSIEDFINYINNLQTENQQLKIQVSAREEVANKLQSTLEEIREYIKEHISYEKNVDGFEEPYLGGYEISDLLQIIDKGMRCQ